MYDMLIICKNKNLLLFKALVAIHPTSPPYFDNPAPNVTSHRPPLLPMEHKMYVLYSSLHGPQTYPKLLMEN